MATIKDVKELLEQLDGEFDALCNTGDAYADELRATGQFEALENVTSKLADICNAIEAVGVGTVHAIDEDEDARLERYIDEHIDEFLQEQARLQRIEELKHKHFVKDYTEDDEDGEGVQ